MVERETKILRDKKSRRIIKMDRNKANNDKYTYNIVDTNQGPELDYESKFYNSDYRVDKQITSFPENDKASINLNHPSRFLPKLKR